ncbi:MAG: hybrid sensor histidine kinase/response regulator [Ignavibacteriaceae bacterium]
MVKFSEELKILNRDEFLSKFLIQAPIGIITFTKDWKVDFINENFIKYALLYQFEHQSLIGKNILEIDLFPGVEIKNNLLSLHEKLSFEKEVKSLTTLDRKHLSVILKGSPIFHNDIFFGGILIIEDLKFSVDKPTDLRFEHIENVLNKISDYIFIADTEGKIKYSYGKKIDQLVDSGKVKQDGFVNSLLSKNDKKNFDDALNLSVKEGKSNKTNIELSFQNETSFYECRIEPLLNWREQTQLIFIFFSDITEIENEIKLLGNEIIELKQYQFITETVTDAVFAIDIEGKILFWNKASESLFGYMCSEVYGKFLGKVLDVFDQNYLKELNEQLKLLGFWKVNLTVYKKDGEKEIVEAKFSLSSENSSSIIVLCSDVTERTLIEQQLRASEEKFRNIIDSTSNLICSTDLNGKIIFANLKFYSTLKYSEKEIQNKNIKEIIEPDFLRIHNFDLKTIDKEKFPALEIPFISKFGEKIILEADFTPVYQNNLIKSINGIFKNTAVEKNINQELEVFKSSYQAFQDGVAVECDRKITLANKAFAEIFGYKNENEILNKDILEFIADNDIQKIAGYFDLVNLNKDFPSRFDFLGKRKDRGFFFAEVTLGTFVNNEKTFVVIVVRDVTERKRAQQIIKESEEKYRNITENIDDFLFTYERIENIIRPIFYTSSVEKITGYTQSDFLSDSRLFIKIIYPDDFPSLRKKIKNFISSRIQLSSEFEFRIINKHGNIVWVRTKINLVRDSSGKAQKIYGLVSDITLRKKAEEELHKSTENLVKLNETKDRFISIISHDLRTPFSSILGFTDLLLSDSDLNQAEKKQYIEFIQESSKSMLSLVNSLLDWTRLQTGRIRFEPERIEANKIIENSFNALSGVAFQKKIDLVSNVEDGTFIFVDKDLILQAFNNLISNAIKFTREHGAIKISCSPTSKMRFLEFSVKDNGIGIKAENLEKLFTIDTKFTSEGTAGEKGTGLGLSLVREIIEKHGGSIWVESEEGSGSDFKFTLPIASTNILLVDDSKTDRLLYSKILKNITPDYNIEVASNGKEALEIIFNHPPALVITDHIMPEMTGYQLIVELKKSEMKGKPPVIILSSDIDRHAIQDYTELGIEYVFHKPVNLSNFKQAVEKSLKKGLLN